MKFPEKSGKHYRLRAPVPFYSSSYKKRMSAHRRLSHAQSTLPPAVFSRPPKLIAYKPQGWQVNDPPALARLCLTFCIDQRWAGDQSRHFAQLSHASQNPGRYWYRSSNAWPEILASANVPKICTFTKIAHLQFIAGLHLPLEARILMKAGGGACIGSAGVDACSFLLPHHVFSKYSLYPRRKSLRKATNLETRNQKFFAQKEKEFKQKA